MLKIATTTAINVMISEEKEIISVKASKVVMESPPLGDNSNHPILYQTMINRMEYLLPIIP
ncbi:hypothetical protein GCM10010954_21540 [Halobacillus andaensis]|uniref:Uncharacterized protein n=1 Tax=Halobacillus andaensis TaxID=1176239 RepID=A0A917B436_HALAA|nr:hypothetical protein [Halobacillus andaensis]MBP2004338.1 hypothetical protein [Halobacillus andaensis]GGF22432.1 hypothetical protein GCM10010954_21540 [Halobacillus andaensis]